MMRNDLLGKVCRALFCGRAKSFPRFVFWSRGMGNGAWQRRLQS